MHVNSRLAILFVSVTLITHSTGCTSIKTRPLAKDRNGNLYGTSHHEGIRGVPCKFKIPKGTRVELLEDVVIFNNGYVSILNGPRGIRSDYRINLSEISEDLHFMVDIPRPIAGTLDIGSEDKSGFEFNKEGYLQGIGAKVEDTTISDITEAVTSLSPFLTKNNEKYTADGGDKTKPIVEYRIITRVVATKEFYWDSPSWHLEMNEWLSCHGCGKSITEVQTIGANQQKSPSVVKASFRTKPGL
jgi:hypothetical protein